MGETDDNAQAPAPPDLRVSELRVGDQDLVVLSIDAATPYDDAALTHAEREVVALLLAGHSNRDIARLRATSERTAANQIANIFRKLDVSSRAELVARLMDRL